MKTTVDLPDPLFRRAKMLAAERGISLKSFITKAVEQSISTPARPWSSLLASLPEVSAETLATVQARIVEADAIDLSQANSER